MIIDRFKKITNYDLLPFYSVANVICTQYQQNSNNLNTYLDPNTNKVLQQLKSAIDDILALFETYKTQLVETIFFQLLDNIETIDDTVTTLLNAKKWGRYFKSSLIENQIPEVDYVLRQNQTLESVAANVLQSDNPNDDWFDIALNNDLNEEKYSSQGGVNLKLPLHLIGLRSINIQSVVDVIDQDTIKGKDIYRVLTFVYDPEIDSDDLKNVTGYDCAKQATEILASLVQGDNPDFPGRGMQREIVIGTNLAFLNYPTILRQLNDTFSDDDTLINFNITNFQQQGTAIFVEFQVQTRVGELITEQLQ